MNKTHEKKIAILIYSIHYVPQLININLWGMFFKITSCISNQRSIILKKEKNNKESWPKTRGEFVKEPALWSKPVGRYRSGTHSGRGWQFTVRSTGRLLIREGAELWNRKASDNLIDWAFCRHGSVVVRAGTDEIIEFFVRHRSNA